MFKFFVQPQVDVHDRQVYGYETLLRKYGPDGWRVPTNFLELSIAEQATLLEQTAQELGPKLAHQFLAFNLNQAQFDLPDTLPTILKLKQRLKSVNLAIEFTEAPTLAQMKHYSEVLHAHDMMLDLDDVGTGSNTYANIKAFLPYADKIKFAMQNLRMTGDADKIPEQLAFWTQQAEKNQLTMILEGIEDPQDQALAAKYQVTIHQGYFYSQPVAPKALALNFNY
ncbi:EAL domain-containing protein [Lactiplantibacillus mudanjiangensis]|uniref:EAL domain-containing protein n=1 Tax=Lactiplantibacillus mudanjiangensis TaxID=1296538 RepID=UPI001031EF4F|nr:EAL domain-containing protein [Lactiplantibacillus mudanjiangensis]